MLGNTSASAVLQFRVHIYLLAVMFLAQQIWLGLIKLSLEFGTIELWLVNQQILGHWSLVLLISISRVEQILWVSDRHITQVGNVVIWEFSLP